MINGKFKKITLPAFIQVMKSSLFVFFILTVLPFSTQGKTTDEGIITGAEQSELYLPKLLDKRIGLMVNHTSMVKGEHLIDYLLDRKINVTKLFSVEHGLRGNVPDGELIPNTRDEKTGLPILSLYGEKKKPSKTDISGLDVVIYDIQDVGCRFYTYISSLHYLMEACAENNVLLIILDRPNPNGDYVDGPVLRPEYKSFVGMHPIPIVHGCTIGELALMINGEKWLSGKLKCKLEVITVKNYTHSMTYMPPVKPSPNLPNYKSIRLYPSLCLFEATNVSIGRGTDFPFQVIGFPNNKTGSFSFTPKSIKGMSDKPLHEGKECRGVDLRSIEPTPKFTISYFIQFYLEFNKPKDFWKSERWINLLTGSATFYQHINQHLSEEQIKASWQNDLKKYKSTRKKYLLYPDFE
jgi:uncharacterized protein YbbC (DUF1343 family)